MSEKTTPSGRALEDAIDRLPYGKNTDETLAGHWVNDNYDAIIRALKIAAAVDGDELKRNPPSNPESHDEYMADFETQAYDAGVNYTLERLKGIGHDENR